MRPMHDVIIWIGGIALLAATAVDTLAVIGRQVGLPLRGSIELVQVAVLIAGSLALIAATAANQHARVHLLIDRMRAGRRGAELGSDLLTVLFFACLLAGSLWLSLDLWNSHEMSEIVGVPWRWLRLFANLCLLGVIALVLGRMVRGRGR